MTTRPKFTSQEYTTLVDALRVVKERIDNAASMIESRGARSILPSTDYHVALLQKIAANSEEPAL